MRRWQRILLRIVYWVAVLVVSLALLVVLILLIESRDQSAVDHGARAGGRAHVVPGGIS